MSQNSLTLPTTGTVSGLQMTQYTNNAIDTLNTLSSGASAPASAEAGQLWHDTTNNVLKLRSLDNTSWIALLNLNETSYLAAPVYASQITGSVNRIINGAMLVDQVNEGSSYSIPVSNTPSYAADQWIVQCSSTSGTPASSVTAQRVSDAPAGYVNSLKVTVGGGASSVNATDFLQICQPIEGYSISDLNYGGASAIATSMSFWVKSSVAGVYAVTLQNGAANRSCVSKFTIASPNVWQQVTLANLPGDSSGTYNVNNTVGLNFIITIAAGSGLQNATLGSFISGDYVASATQNNTILTTTGATFQLAGVMFHPGAFCLPEEKRPIEQELHSCLRYYEKSFSMGTAVAQNAGVNGSSTCTVPIINSTGVRFGGQTFAVRKRTAPTITLYNPAAANSDIHDYIGNIDFTSGTENIGDNGFSLFGNVPNTTFVGRPAAVHWAANARM